MGVGPAVGHGRQRLVDGPDEVHKWRVGRNVIKAYERFVTEGLHTPSPWSELSAQVFLGRKPFLTRMQRLAAKQTSENISRAQRQPARPDAQTILADVAKRYGLTPKQVLDRSHAHAFKSAVYRLRREANLPLREVSAIAAVSPGRISQIQAEIERDDEL